MGLLLGLICVSLIAYFFFRVRVSCPQCNQKTGFSSSHKKAVVRTYWKHMDAEGLADERFEDEDNPMGAEFKYFFTCKKCGNHFHEIRKSDNLSIDQIKEILYSGTDEQHDLHVKNRLRYIDFAGVGLSPKKQKHNDEMDRLDNEEKEKNYLEIGIRETNSERQKREQGQVYLQKLQERFGEEMGLKIKNDELSVGMTKEMIIEMKREPAHKKQSTSRGKVREEWFYKSYKNRLGKDSYKFRVVIVDGLVEGWNDIA